MRPPPCHARARQRARASRWRAFRQPVCSPTAPPSPARYRRVRRPAEERNSPTTMQHLRLISATKHAHHRATVEVACHEAGARTDPTATAARITASSAARRRKRCAWSSAARTRGGRCPRSRRWPRPSSRAPRFRGLPACGVPATCKRQVAPAALGDQAGGLQILEVEDRAGSRLKKLAPRSASKLTMAPTRNSSSPRPTLSPVFTPSSANRRLVQPHSPASGARPAGRRAGWDRAPDGWCRAAGGSRPPPP